MRPVAEHAVSVSNLEKLLWPHETITKAELISYYIDMAPYLLPILKDKPITMIRFPDGITEHSFFQKHAPASTPEWVHTVILPSREHPEGLRAILVDSVSTLIWLANQACIEIHIGFAKHQTPTQPDMLAFDLDPSVPDFEGVREVALALRDVLTSIGLQAVPKTSGASGLQVMLPLIPGPTFEETRLVTESIGQYLQHQAPHLVTLERIVKNRGDKVYVDYLQHGRSRTLIAAYSPRGTPGAKVSAPVTWDELGRGAVPADFTVHTMPGRVRNTGDLMRTVPPQDLRPVIKFFQQHSQLTR